MWYYSVALMLTVSSDLSHASTVTLWTALSVGQSTILIQSVISKQRLNG